MLTAERGAARHTIDAYARDLSEFLALLAAKGDGGRRDLRSSPRLTLPRLPRKGLAPTSRARKLSAIRQFFRFLLAEGMRADDPSSAIDSPKLGRPLPKILSLAGGRVLLIPRKGLRTRGQRAWRAAARSGSMRCSKRSMRRACASPS